MFVKWTKYLLVYYKNKIKTRSYIEIDFRYV